MKMYLLTVKDNPDLDMAFESELGDSLPSGSKLSGSLASAIKVEATEKVPKWARKVGQRFPSCDIFVEMVTPMSDDEYLAYPFVCPICRKECLDQGAIDTSGDFIFANVLCMNCGYAFVENYSLTGYENDKNRT